MHPLVVPSPQGSSRHPIPLVQPEEGDAETLPCDVFGPGRATRAEMDVQPNNTTSIRPSSLRHRPHGTGFFIPECVHSLSRREGLNNELIKQATVSESTHSFTLFTTKPKWAPCANTVPPCVTASLSERTSRSRPVTDQVLPDRGHHGCHGEFGWENILKDRIDNSLPG